MKENEVHTKTDPQLNTNETAYSNSSHLLKPRVPGPVLNP